jgi:WD40 repeat protein
LRIWLAFLCLSCSSSADEPRLVIDSGGHQAAVTFLAFTKDGKHLVSAGEDKVIRVWDIASGTARVIRGQIGDGPLGMIYAAALSPDNRYIAVGGWLGPDVDRSVIRIHELQTGKVVALLRGHTSVILSLAFSPDGRYLASGSRDETVGLWDTSEWRNLRFLIGHRHDVYAVSFSPDGKHLVSGSYDGTLRIWEVASGKLIADMGNSGEPVRAAAASPDGRYIVTMSAGGSMRVWDANTGVFVGQMPTPGGIISNSSFSPDGRLLVTGSGPNDFISHVFEIPSGREVAHFAGHQNLVLATAFSSDGHTVASAGGDQHEIDLWGAKDGQLFRRFVGAGQPVWAVGFGEDGRSIAFGTTFKPVSVSNLGPLEKTLRFDEGQSSGISLRAVVDSAFAFRRAQEQVGAIRIATRPGRVPHTDVLQIFRAGRLQHEILPNLSSEIYHHAYSLSPDGAAIASGTNNADLSIYSTDRARTIAGCVGHTSEVLALAFSADGKTLVSGSVDQTMRLWDVSQSGCRQLLSVFVGAQNEWVAWTPQGYYAASANGDRYIGWQVNGRLDELAKFFGVKQYQRAFYRPDVVAEFLKTRDIETAVRAANGRRGGASVPKAVLGPDDVSKYPPPDIFIADPKEDRATVQEGTVHARAFADSRLPITRFELFVNGTSVVQGLGGTSMGSLNKRELEADVPLHPGVNEISISASNARADSLPETRTVMYAAPKTNQPKLILLAIGVSRYQYPPLKLDWADKDALEVESTFLHQKGHLYSDVTTKHLTNEHATKENILDALHWLQEGDDQDIRVLFISGHGGLDDHGNYYFYAVDHDPTKDIDLRDLRWETLLDRLTGDRRKAVLLVDSCHAGAVTGTHTRGEVDFEQVLREMKSKFHGLFTLAASMGTESSFESDQWKHGAFTAALLDTFKRSAPSESVLSTDDIAYRVTAKVREYTKEQQHPRSTYTEALTSFPLFWSGTP